MSTTFPSTRCLVAFVLALCVWKCNGASAGPMCPRPGAVGCGRRGLKQVDSNSLREESSVDPDLEMELDFELAPAPAPEPELELELEEPVSIQVLTHKTIDRVLGKLPSDANVIMILCRTTCFYCFKFGFNIDVMGQFFMSEPRVQPEVFVFRIECVTDKDREVCFDSDQFDAEGTPTVLFGSAADMIDRNTFLLWNLPYHKSAQEMISFVGDIVGVEYGVGTLGLGD